MEFKSKIAEFIERYQATFPEMWWLELRDKKSIIKWNQKIREFETEILVLVAKSILSGEYVINTSQVDEDLKQLCEILSEDFNDELAGDAAQRLYKTFRSSMAYQGLVARRYRQAIENVMERSVKQYQEMQVMAFHYAPQTEAFSRYSQVYDNLFKLNKIDFYFANNVDQISELLLIWYSLSQCKKEYCEIEDLLDVLIDKCVFLLNKHLADVEQVDYAIDFVYKHVGKKDLKCSEVLDDLWQKAENYTKEHYIKETSFWRNIQQDIASGGQDVHISDMALLMKYYKDAESPSEQQVENLITHFNELYNKKQNVTISSQDYEQYALHTLKNYMYNCQLSYRIHNNKEYDIDTLKKDMIEIERIQKETGILNFYPFKKAITFILDQIDKHREDVEYLERAYILLKEYAKEYRGAFVWCDKMYFYPIQSLFKECVVHYPKFGDVYIPSSFCRPINYHLIKQDMNECLSKINAVDVMIHMAKEKREIEDVKKQIDKSNDKNIELLTIFTSIITFLFGCINFFAETQTLHGGYFKLLANVVVLGFVLLLFINLMLIWRILTSSSYKQTHWRWQLVLAICCCLIFVIATIWLVVKLYQIPI